MSLYTLNKDFIATYETRVDMAKTTGRFLIVLIRLDIFPHRGLRWPTFPPNLPESSPSSDRIYDFVDRMMDGKSYK